MNAVSFLQLALLPLSLFPPTHCRQAFTISAAEKELRQAAPGMMALIRQEQKHENESLQSNTKHNIGCVS